MWTPRSARGAPARWSTREIVNAVLYVLRGGTAWRALPHDYPPWQTVYDHFRQLKMAGVWEHINTSVRRLYRVQIGRTPDLHAAIIDSQSAQTTESGGPRGFDGNKKVNGRKRHTLVDTLGPLLKVVHPANLHNRIGGRLLVEAVKGQWATLEKIRADQGDAGQVGDWASQELDLVFEFVSPWWRQLKRYMPEWLEAQGLGEKAFHVLPSPWVVERSFAWMGRNRRLSRDFETLPETEETWCHLAMARLLLRRLSTI